MPSVSFINPAVNYGAEGQDFQAEAQALQRKRAVSDALLKHSMETGINVPVAHSANELSSVISPFAAIGKVGETYLANRAVNNQEGKEVDLAQRYKAAENAAVQDFLAGDANDEKHLMKGMASQFAPVKSAAMEVYKEKMKGKLTPKDLLTAPNMSGESRVAAAIGGGAEALKEQPQFHTVGEGQAGLTVVPSDPSKTTTILDKSKQYQRDEKGQPIVVKKQNDDGSWSDYQLEVGTGKLEAIDKSARTNVKVNVEGSKARTQLEEEASKALAASGLAAKSAVQSISTAHQIKSVLEEDKAITGTGATTRTILTRLGNTLGITGKDGEEKLANTGKLVQSLAQTELDASYQMKGQGQITENERALLKRTAAGDFGNSAAELQARIDVVEKAGRNRIKAHGTNMTQYAKAYPEVKTDFFDVPEPPAYQSRMDKYKAKPPGGMAAPQKSNDDIEQYRVR